MTTNPPDSTVLEDALASIYDAGAVRVPPWMGVVAALASAHPATVGETIDWLVVHRAHLEDTYARGQAAPLALATVPAAMQYQPELGFLDRARDDHALRERYLFADVVGKQSFYQTAIYAMTGLQLSAPDADMLDQLGNANLQIDRRAWPLAVTRRIAARGAGYAAAVVGGTAMMGAQVLAGAAAADCARFLRRARGAELEGRSVDTLVAELLARKERVMGFGRPLVGSDERVPVMERIIREHGRADLPYVTLLRAADEAFFAHKGLRSTAAAWAAAILTDLGLSPEAVQAVSNYWVIVCVYAQALFAGERGLVPGK